MSCSDVAAVWSITVSGITVTLRGVFTRSAVNFGEAGSAAKWPSTSTPRTSCGASSARAAGATISPARPATAAGVSLPCA